MSERGSALALAALLVGCSRAPVPSEPASHPETVPSSARAAAASSKLFASASAARPSPALSDESCALGFEPSGGAELQLAALAERCAAGMSALGDKPERLSLAANAAGLYSFSIADASRCIRALAVATPSVEALELELLDDANHSYGIDARAGTFAMVGVDGVVCLKSPGRYRARVRARRGSGDVSVRVYQAD